MPGDCCFAARAGAKHTYADQPDPNGPTGPTPTTITDAYQRYSQQCSFYADPHQYLRVDSHPIIPHRRTVAYRYPRTSHQHACTNQHATTTYRYTRADPNANRYQYTRYTDRDQYTYYANRYQYAGHANGYQHPDHANGH